MKMHSRQFGILRAQHRVFPALITAVIIIILVALVTIINVIQGWFFLFAVAPLVLVVPVIRF
jgi:hypothetical protein